MRQGMGNAVKATAGIEHVGMDHVGMDCVSMDRMGMDYVVHMDEGMSRGCVCRARHRRV